MRRRVREYAGPRRRPNETFVSGRATLAGSVSTLAFNQDKNALTTARLCSLKAKSALSFYRRHYYVALALVHSHRLDLQCCSDIKRHLPTCHPLVTYAVAHRSTGVTIDWQAAPLDAMSAKPLLVTLIIHALKGRAES